MSEVIIHSYFHSDWITLLFLFLFFLLTFAKIAFKNRLTDLFSIFSSKKYFLTYGKKDAGILFNGFNAIVFTLLVGTITLLVTSYFVLYKQDVFKSTEIHIIFMEILLYVIAYYTAKHILGIVLASFFNLKSEQLRFSFIKLSYYGCILMVFLPFILFLFYGKVNPYTSFTITISIFSILLLIRYLFVFKNRKNIFLNRPYYFFLYLCTLELTPLLIVLKLTI